VLIALLAPKTIGKNHSSQSPSLNILIAPGQIININTIKMIGEFLLMKSQYLQTIIDQSKLKLLNLMIFLIQIKIDRFSDSFACTFGDRTPMLQAIDITDKTIRSKQQAKNAE
jgi:type II secretory pathway component PulF